VRHERDEAMDVSEGFLMSLDLGGGGLRCLLLEPHTRRVVTAFRPWAARPVPEVPMGMEYEPAATWSILTELAREVRERAGIGPERVLGIAATSMRHGSALLDAQGHELLLAPNRDARGLAPTFELAAAHGEEFHRRTGHWPNPVQPAGRLRWLATEAPGTLARVATHLSLSDWIAWRLCGERASEPSQAGETLLLEIERPAWAWDLIDRLELPREIFPTLRTPGSLLGRLRDAAAAELGLRAGTPVAVGGADTQCGLLGAGVVAHGQLGVIAGTSAPVLQVRERPLLDDAARLWAVHHVLPERWALESNAGGAGEALDWIAGLLYPDAEYPIVHLVAEAREAPVGSAGLVSTFGAEVMNARNLALPVGDLTLNYVTSAGDPARRRLLARSVLEGMACALRANAEQIEATSGDIADTIRVSGGISRSALFSSIASDVFGRPVQVTEAMEATALGGALCAGVGAGLFRNLEEAVATVVRVAREHVPDAERSAFYADHYARWNELRKTRADSEAQASGFAIGALAATAAAPSHRGCEFRPRILVAAELDAASLDALGQLGDVEYRSYRQEMRLLAGPGLVQALQGIHVFVTEVDVVDAASLLAARDLRVIGICRGDAVNVDVEACTALGIPLIHTPGRNAEAVAELALAFMLMLARQLPEAGAFLHEAGGEAGDMGRMGRAFGKLQGRELWSKTVGLIGLGAVGREVVKRLRPFGARCLVFDPHVEPDIVRLAGAEPVSLEALLGASDFVSLHAAVSEESRGLLGAEQLARMKPGGFLVNTARAALVDEAALLHALESGALGGAALDVFAVEPPAWDDPLLQLPNVIATPHVGGNTREVAAHQGRILAEDLQRLRRGEAPRHALNPVTLAGFRWSEPRPEPPPELVEKLAGRSGPTVTDLEKQTRAPRSASRPAPHEPKTPTGRKAKGAAVASVRESMERLLRDFIDRIVADAGLKEFARGGSDVTLHFTLLDLGSAFHIGFHDGEVIGDLGPPSGDAGVLLKMRADLLDGMFTGRRNAMQAAMNGELSFSGDTAEAMTLTHIEDDLMRLYRAAREAVGDPGDLASLPDPEAGAAAPAPTRTRTAPARDSSVPPDDVRHELSRIVDELYAAQLITATGGNASVRIPGKPDEAWITPSQLFKGDLSPEILVRIGSNGRALDEGARSPSSEASMHAAVLEAKPEAQAVIHCHAPHATILVNADLPFLPISTEAAFFQNIGRIPFVMPGSRELAQAVVEALGDGWAVLMQNHGLLVAGRTLRRAADMADIIERTSQVIIGCYAVGKEPPVLPRETIETLARYGDLMA
jgi:autoinducer 2 (AI-2) kinase